MDLHQLEAFAIVAKEKSFSRAAEILHLTQPAISSRIANLESEIQVDLFYRDGRTVHLSKYGEMFEPYVKRILSLANEAKENINQFRNHETSRLEIGTTSRIATYLLPILLEQFQNQEPGVELLIQTAQSETINEMLGDGTIDIGLLNHPIDDSLYEKVTLMQDNIILVASPEHALYEQYQLNGAFSFAQLNEVNIINYKDQSVYYRSLVELMRKNQIVPKQLISVDNIEAMKRMASRKAGVAFLPRMAVLRELREGRLTEIPFEEQHSLKIETFLVYQRKRYINPMVLRFVTIVQRFLATNEIYRIWE